MYHIYFVLVLTPCAVEVKVFSNECAFAALRADGSVVTWGDPDGGGDSAEVSELLEATGYVNT